MPTLAHNKQAAHEYEFLESFEAGIALTGPEVKSVKAGRISLRGSYVSIDVKGTIELVGAHISTYAPAGPAGQPPQQDPDRRRTLLMRSREINQLRGKLTQSGLTILPKRVYTKGSLIKVEVVLGRGKKCHDKRETIKKREAQKQIRRRLKSR
ncbi:SsrA-binding protein [bacterium]|nr:SsrA-binding protein [bacterium]|tara:strand:+ start:154 stop:612 length:459 start_codon:yes stop_codon:yes gene_type:complete